MASLRSQIIGAVVAALNGPGKPAGLQVYRFRLSPVDKTKLPAIVVRPMAEEVSKEHARSPVMRRTLRLNVQCFAAPTAGMAVDDSLDAVLVWASKAVLGTLTHGGLAITTSESRTEWDADEADQVYAGATVEFLIDYTTKTSDQESKQ